MTLDDCIRKEFQINDSAPTLKKLEKEEQIKPNTSRKGTSKHKSKSQWNIKQKNYREIQWSQIPVICEDW